MPDRGAIHEPRIDHDRVIQEGGPAKGDPKRERKSGGDGEEERIDG